MSHRHDSRAASQNQGNALGDRSCVRQSKLYRQYESGNDVKSILGTSHLCWDPNQKEGAYYGQKVFDHERENAYPVQDQRSHDNDLQNTKRINHHYSVDHPINRKANAMEAETYAPDETYYRQNGNYKQTGKENRRSSFGGSNDAEEQSTKYTRFKDEMNRHETEKYSYEKEEKLNGRHGRTQSGNNGRSNNNQNTVNSGWNTRGRNDDEYETNHYSDKRKQQDVEIYTNHRGGPPTQNTRPW